MNNKRPATRAQETLDLKNRIQELENMIRQLSANSNPNVEIEEGVDIRSDDYIPVMSLSNIPLNLSTAGNGKGKIFRFTRFGESKNLLFSDLLDIVENQRTFLENGLFYIANNIATRKLGLNELYSRILTKDKIEQIIKCESFDVVAVYSSANVRQREVINEMIIEKLASGEGLDLNIIGAISRVSKIDFVGRAEELKEFNKK